MAGKADKVKALKYIGEYIDKQLNDPVAVRTRRLAALSAKNPVIKITWEQPSQSTPREGKP